MPNIITPNLSMTLPEVGAAKDTWGTLINTNFTILDTLLAASGQIPRKNLPNTFTQTNLFNGLAGVNAVLADTADALVITDTSIPRVSHRIPLDDVTAPTVPSSSASILTRQMGDLRYGTLLAANSYAAVNVFTGSTTSNVEVGNPAGSPFVVRRNSDSLPTHAIWLDDVAFPTVPSLPSSILTRIAGDSRYAMTGYGNTFEGNAVFKGNFTLDRANPYIRFYNSDSPTPYSRSFVGGAITEAFIIAPAAGDGSYNGVNNGAYRMQRNATGVTAHLFTGFNGVGSITLAVGGVNGTANFVRSGRGTFNIHDGTTNLVMGGSGATAITQFISCVNSANSQVMRVLATGNVQNANNSYGALSDLRLKRDVAPASSQLDDIRKLNVVNYSLKDDPDRRKQVGLIAQEVMRVKPGLVEQDDEGLYGVKYSVLVPLLVKAVQELADRLDTVTGV